MNTPSKPPAWVLLADEGRARIIDLDGAELRDVDEPTDAAAHADNAELRRDAHGRRAGSGTLTASNRTESAGEEKLDHEADAFARRIAARLTEALQAQRYSSLRIARRRASSADCASISMPAPGRRWSTSWTRTCCSSTAAHWPSG